MKSSETLLKARKQQADPSPLVPGSVPGLDLGRGLHSLQTPSASKERGHWVEPKPRGRSPEREREEPRKRCGVEAREGERRGRGLLVTSGDEEEKKRKKKNYFTSSDPHHDIHTFVLMP